MSLSTLIPPNSKFSCIAFRSASVADLGDTPILFGDGLSAVSGIPFELQDPWREWIGSLQSDELLKANLLLFATAPSRNPEVLDAENETLRSSIDRIFYGLVLQGLRFDRGYILSGAHYKDSIDVRQFTTLRNFHPNPERDPTLIAPASLGRGTIIAKGIEEIFRPVTRLRDGGFEPKVFRRLRRGFLALLRGYEEDWWDTRLHQFVRAIEALLFLPIGESTRKFAHRGHTFIGSSETSHNLLREIYRLRSCAEHMNDPDNLVRQHPDPQRVAWMRCLQSEIIASEVYLHLLTSPGLLMRFENDDKILTLWNEPDDVVHKIWGTPFDLNAIVHKIHRPIFGLGC